MLRGAAYAALLPGVLLSRVPHTRDGVPLPVSVWTSTLQRTIMTAGGLPLPKVQWKALDEIQVSSPPLAARPPAHPPGRHLC